MGNTNNSSQKELKLHVIMYEWLGTKSINLKAPEERFNQKDYLITQQGNAYFDIKRKVYEWRNVRQQRDTNKDNIALHFDMNSLNTQKKKLESYLSNISKQKEHSHYIWQIINFMKKNQQQIGIKVEEGQCFKIGSQIMKLKAFVSKNMIKKQVKKNINTSQDQNCEQYYSLRDLREIDSIKDLPDIIEKELTCRICLEKETKVNRFHNFCGCKKTMPTHLNCLKLWLKKNSQFNENNDMQCDICKTQFPSTYVSKEGIEKLLVEPDIPQNIPYVLLEIYKIQDANVIKALMLIEQTQDQFLTLGRSDDSDIRFKHHSISREHCIFKINKKGFFLIDKDSKFGTFVQMDQSKLKKKEEIMLQIENYLIEIHPFRSTPCQCIELRDYRKIETNPFKDTQSFKKKKSRNKVQTTINNKQNIAYKYQCSLEEIQEDPSEKLLKSHQAKEIDLFQSRASQQKQNNQLNTSNQNIAEILENKSFRESLGFRSILFRNTVNNRDGNLDSNGMETRNELDYEDNQHIFSSISFNEPQSQSYRFDQQLQLNIL